MKRIPFLRGNTRGRDHTHWRMNDDTFLFSQVDLSLADMLNVSWRIRRFKLDGTMHISGNHAVDLSEPWSVDATITAAPIEVYRRMPWRAPPDLSSGFFDLETDSPTPIDDEQHIMDFANPFYKEWELVFAPGVHPPYSRQYLEVDPKTYVNAASPPFPREQPDVYTVDRGNLGFRLRYLAGSGGDTTTASFDFCTISSPIDEQGRPSDLLPHIPEYGMKHNTDGTFGLESFFLNAAMYWSHDQWGAFTGSVGFSLRILDSSYHTPVGALSFLGRSFPIYPYWPGSGTFGPGLADSYTADFTITPTKWWPYMNSLGQQVYDEDTGVQLNDPFA